jgi:hypothetical protein
VISTEPVTPGVIDASALVARLAAREERIGLLEEENRWLKSQLFGRSSEKSKTEEISPDQAWLFNEAEALAKAAAPAPESVTIPAHERAKRGRKKLSADLPRARDRARSARGREVLRHRWHRAGAHRRRACRATAF